MSKKEKALVLFLVFVLGVFTGYFWRMLAVSQHNDISVIQVNKERKGGKQEWIQIQKLNGNSFLKAQMTSEQRM